MKIVQVNSSVAKKVVKKKRETATGIEKRDCGFSTDPRAWFSKGG
jgi:hypothetical protein